MKKIFFINLAIFLLIGFIGNQASGECIIRVELKNGEYIGPTAETTRTQQATYDAYMVFRENYPPPWWPDNDYACGSDFGVSLPTWNGTCYVGCMGTITESGVTLIFCIDGSWSYVTHYGGDVTRVYQWDIISCETTIIKLSSLKALPLSGKVYVIWSTESEIDNAGFNIYRSDSENGEYTKINDALIPAQGFSTQGASYKFIDTNVQNRKTYYYKLEDIDLNGTSTMHGPVSATPRLIYGVGK